ncbi:BTB/POZ domain-containing protein 16 [Pristis pectinata]|uniref:BTB/POZ domain-containing protein 16 n=1 Tax=Pristis pectinata TaxID=685728 RepID=UPI00223E1E90|nr:BTB/POZ domain-containing protein 16 [Pristis pectinata]
MGNDTGDLTDDVPEPKISEPPLPYNPRPPKLRKNMIGRSATLLKASFSDFLSQAPYQTLKEVSLTDKVRIQAGITNRFQAKMPLDSDLLGRAQATKAVQLIFLQPTGLLKMIYVHLQLKFLAVCPICQSVILSQKPEVQLNQSIIKGDVVLESMNTLWELHSQFFSKSERLLDLLNASDQSEYCRNKSKEIADVCQTGGLYYCGPEDACCESKPDKLKRCNLCNIHNKENCWATTTTKNLKRIINLKLDVKDPLVTTEGFAIALGNLYNDKPEVEAEHILGVFAAAAVLKFKLLFNKCATVMLDNINTTTVCHFHQAALKYNQEKLRQACERWLELNLIVHLRYKATLRDLQMDVLQKTLLSPRLFTFTEYHILQTILSWVFLQVNTEVRLMPPYGTIIAYFISLHKLAIYMEKEIRQKYFGLFQTIRLHGITETRQIEELQQIDLLPQAILLQVVTHNYYALQHGGDMPCVKYFPSEAIRFGFIMTERLNHADSNIPFGITERNAFSLRQEREVKYEILVQTQMDDEWQVFTTGNLCQKFGVTKMSCQSQILLVAGLTMPVYVTFALLFPVS